MEAVSMEDSAVLSVNVMIPMWSIYRLIVWARQAGDLLSKKRMEFKCKNYSDEADKLLACPEAQSFGFLGEVEDIVRELRALTTAQTS